MQGGSQADLARSDISQTSSSVGLLFQSRVVFNAGEVLCSRVAGLPQEPWRESATA